MAQAVKSPASRRGCPGSISGQSMWDLWWTKWHWDRFSPRVLRFSPVNFIPLVLHYLEIFITGLHNKHQGCGASVASAVGPYTRKKTSEGTTRELGYISSSCTTEFS
jgi:hypothetical protein